MLKSAEKCATELKAGEIIRLEYGDYDNWVNFVVDHIEVLEKMVCVKCHHKSVNSEPAFGLNEKVRVIEVE